MLPSAHVRYNTADKATESFYEHPKMAAHEFAKYDTPGLEPEIANESDRIQAHHDLVNRTQQKNFACHRNGFRGTLVKA